jgi:hypothetical protein
VTSDGKRILLDDHDFKNMHLIIGAIAHRLMPDKWTAHAKNAAETNDAAESMDSSKQIIHNQSPLLKRRSLELIPQSLLSRIYFLHIQLNPSSHLCAPLPNPQQRLRKKIDAAACRIGRGFCWAKWVWMDTTAA